MGLPTFLLLLFLIKKLVGISEYTFYSWKCIIYFKEHEKTDKYLLSLKHHNS